MLVHFNIRFVTRLHGSRLVDFAHGKNVKQQKNGDFHVNWKRPARPFWMTEWMWAIVPETMTLRLIRVRVDTEGARSKGFFVVTNLMDDKAYPSKAIREVYRGRWQVEVDLRTIKTFMEMDVLRAKTPDMAQREFMMGLLAYNIVRAKMLRTAIGVREEAQRKETKTKKSVAQKMKTPKNKIEAKDVTARNVSFSVALTSIAAAYVTVHFMSETMRNVYRERAELNRRSTQVGNRPNRVEPRCNKRRPKAHRLMLKPREELRAQLKRGEHPTQDGDEAAVLLGEE